MSRFVRTILAVFLSMSLAWLPMQSYAGMADAAVSGKASGEAAAVHCHGSMASDSNESTGHTMGKMTHDCCCNGCDCNGDSGCIHHVSMAVLTSQGILAVDRHQTVQAAVSFALNDLSYSPPIPPPLV